MEVVSLSDYVEKPPEQVENCVFQIIHLRVCSSFTRANVRQLTHKLPNKSAVVLINLFLWVVQALNKVDR